MSASRLLTGFFILTPAIVLFSGMAMAPLLMLMALLAAIAVPGSVRKHPAAQWPALRYIAGCLALMLALPLLSTVWSITPEISASTTLRAVLLCTLGLAAIAYAPALRPLSIKNQHAYVLAIILVSLLVLQEWATGGGIIASLYEQMDKPYDRFIAKNVNRGLCALSVFIWPAMLLLHAQQKRKQAWWLMALLAAAILLLHSLSAKLGLMAGLAAYVGIRAFPRTVPWLITMAVPVLLLSFPAVYLLLEHSFFGNEWVAAHLPLSSMHRVSIWHVLMQEIAQKPWLGWGIDTTRNLPLSAEQLSYIRLDIPPLHPHNPSMQLLVEQGIIGLLLTAAASLLLLRKWQRSPAPDPIRHAMLGALIVAYVGAGFASFSIWQHWWIAVLFIAGFFWRWVEASTAKPAA